MINCPKSFNFNPQYYYDAYFSKKNLLTYIFYRVEMNELLAVFQKYKKPPSRILDCACASGLLCYLLYLRNYKVSGFDILKDFVDFAEQKIPNAHIFQSDILTFESPYLYDVISCASIIGRFKKNGRDLIIQNILRHLNEGGILIIASPSRIWWRLSRFWRFIRRKMFPGMTFQDELCGWNKEALEKVTYADFFNVEELVLNKPLKVLEIKRIAFGLVDLLVAQKISIEPENA